MSADADRKHRRYGIVEAMAALSKAEATVITAQEMYIDKENRNMRLQAALGRAVTELRRVVREVAYDCPAHQAAGFQPDCEACVAKNHGNPMATPEACAILADPSCAAAGEYVRALEAVYEAARGLDIYDVPGNRALREAVRKVAARRGK